MSRFSLFSFLTSFILLSSAQVPCVNGKAGDYDCLGIDLQSRISAPNLGAEELNGRWVNDIWGWLDPETNREYALVGMTNGTSFVDITDPVNPVVLGVLPEHNSIRTNRRVDHDEAKSIWRDIKVYQNHAYVVSEDADHGIQVFDLTNLRDVASPSFENVFDETAHYAGVGQAHNVVINEETGYLYVVGFRQGGDFDCNGGGLHIVDISDPKNPVFAGCFDEDGYTHDAQCVIYQGSDPAYVGKEICFNSNEDEVVIVNVDDKNDIQLISKTSYEGVRYTHQGWLTEDHRYFIHNDELDELNLGHNTRTYIWDLADLDDPLLIGFYEHDQKSIDHNLYVKGNYVYESNYTSGLVILDTTGIHNGQLQKVAYFDTYLSNNDAIFAGSWSNYPYFPSGNIVISDITNGLFIVKMQAAFIVEQPQDVIACVGEHVDIPIVAGGSDLSYQWQVNDGSGFADIENFERYMNTRTSTMHAHTLELSQNEYQFRCIISNNVAEIISDPMTVFAIDSPQAIFEYEIIDTQGKVTFSNSSLSAESYLWDFGDGFTSMEAEPIHTYQDDGNYLVELIAENDCTTDTLTFAIELIVLSADDEVSVLSIYPSVAKDHLTIELVSRGSFAYQIFSLGGESVLSGISTKNQCKLDVSQLRSGLYIVEISTDKTTHQQKFIIK